MLKNATYLFPENYWNLSHFVSDLRGLSESSGVPYAMTLWAATFVALLSPVALAGNVLVLAAIWRNPSLRTPSYILLPGLAFTDFSTGLITQPVYVAAKLVRLKIFEGGKDLNIVMGAVTNGCAVLFTSTSLLMITLMSIERWLHMTRRSLVTERRSYIMFAVMLLLPIPLAVYRVLFITMGTHLLAFDIYFVSILLLCLLVTSVTSSATNQQQIVSNKFKHTSCPTTLGNHRSILPSTRGR